MKFLSFLVPLLFFGCSQNKNLSSGDFKILIDDIEIYYTVKGKGPVMFAGHLYSGKIGYELSLKPLEEFFTMVYYDPRGTGKSFVPNTLEQYDYSFLIQEIDSLRKHLKVNKIWVFGHSDQSEIALEYTIEYPQNVEGLILSGTHFVEEQDKELENKRKFETERRKEKWFDEVCKDWDYMIQNNTKTDEYGRDLSYTPIKWWCYDSVSAEKVIPVYNEISKAGRRKPINGKQPFTDEKDRLSLYERIYDYQEKYSQIKAPVLILQGKWDTNNPPESVEKLHQSLPTSDLIWIEQAGHFPWVEQPDESFTKIENWLKTNNHIFK